MIAVRNLFLTFIVLSLFAACTTGEVGNVAAPSVPRPENAIDISIVYMPLTDPYIPGVMEQFNRTYAEGRNPISGAPLADGERPIYITGKEGSSGTLMTG